MDNTHNFLTRISDTVQKMGEEAELHNCSIMVIIVPNDSATQGTDYLCAFGGSALSVAQAIVSSDEEGMKDAVEYAALHGNTRPLESMSDEEAQMCLVECFNVPPHAAYLDIEALKQYLCENTEYLLGIEEETHTGTPLLEFAVTPQTFFNLTRWLLERGFKLF